MDANARETNTAGVSGCEVHDGGLLYACNWCDCVPQYKTGLWNHIHKWHTARMIGSGLRRSDLQPDTKAWKRNPLGLDMSQRSIPFSERANSRPVKPLMSVSAQPSTFSLNLEPSLNKPANSKPPSAPGIELNQTVSLDAKKNLHHYPLVL